MRKYLIMSLLICILTMGAVHINATAAEKFTYNDMVGFLNATEILDEMSEEKQNSEISRIEFSVLAAKMLGIEESDPPENDYFYDIPSDHWGKFSINTLVERCIIKGDGQRQFRPNDTITLPEATVILLRMVNKEYEAELNGGYPNGYVSVAAKYELMTSEVSADKLTYKDAAILIFNALNVELNPLENDDTLLSVYHKMYYDEGQLDAVCGASVNGKSICKINQISIDGEVFESETGWLYDKLGAVVKYYYISDKSGEKTVVYVTKDNDIKNEVVEISSESYIGFENGKVKYYADKEQKKVKSEEVYTGVAVIRNGQNVSDDLKSAFSDFYGHMKLIKTKGHSAFDIVVIEDYENIVVGSIDDKEKIIYNKEDPDISVKLLPEDYDLISYVDIEGNESSFEKIGVGDVIGVAESEDGTFVKVVVVSNEVSGYIESTRALGDSVIIVIDGNEYEFESSYYKKKSPSITMEEKVTIKTDLFGKIVSYDVPKAESYKFSYLVNAFVNDETYGEERVMLKMYTEDSEMLYAVCAPKMEIDSVRYSDTDAIIKALSIGGEVKSQLIRFKYNMKNEIVAIDTKDDSDGAEKSLHLMPAEKSLYKHWTNLVGYNAYVPTSVKVMIVPEEGTEKTATADRFQVKNISAVPSGKASRIDLYQLDEDSLDIDFVVYYTEIKNSVDTYAALNVVEKITQGLTSDDEPAMIFRLDSTGSSVNYAVSPKYEISKDSYTNIDPALIGKGDVIRIATDHKNEITSIQLVFDYSKAKEDGNDKFFDNALNPAYKAVNNVAVGNFFDGFKMSYGYVSRTSGNLIQWGYDKPGDANEIYNVTFESNKAKILIYDETDLEDPCKLGTVNDIVGYYTSTENYSKLIAVSRSAIISNMVVYK